jgi:hypothetical protein
VCPFFSLVVLLESELYRAFAEALAANVEAILAYEAAHVSTELALAVPAVLELGFNLLH